ncbi:hypothetical protein Tco_0281634 [Tanacetum coccineum]
MYSVALKSMLALHTRNYRIRITFKSDCDLKATNIVLQGLPPDVYSLVNHHKVAKEIWDRVRLLMKGMARNLHSKNASVSCIMSLIETSSPLKRLEWLLFNKYKVVLVRVLLGEGHISRQYTQPKRPRNSTWFKEKMLLIQAPESGKVLDEEHLAFLADLGIAEGQVTQTTIP